MKCVSEDQKYGGKGFEAKTNKGDAKQQEWIQVWFVLYTPTVTVVGNYQRQKRASTGSTQRPIFANIPSYLLAFPW